MPDSSDLRPTRTDGLEINIMHDGVVVYQRDAKKIHYLNNTAGLMLDLCDGQRDKAALAAALAEAYDLPESPTEDVETCLRNLLEKGLVR